jgi:hypothetical protein
MASRSSPRVSQRCRSRTFGCRRAEEPLHRGVLRIRLRPGPWSRVAARRAVPGRGRVCRTGCPVGGTMVTTGPRRQGVAQRVDGQVGGHAAADGVADDPVGAGVPRSPRLRVSGSNLSTMRVNLESDPKSGTHTWSPSRTGHPPTPSRSGTRGTRGPASPLRRQDGAMAAAPLSRADAGCTWRLVRGGRTRRFPRLLEHVHLLLRTTTAMRGCRDLVLSFRDGSQLVTLYKLR